MEIKSNTQTIAMLHFVSAYLIRLDNEAQGFTRRANETSIGHFVWLCATAKISDFSIVYVNNRYLVYGTGRLQAIDYGRSVNTACA